MNKVFAKIVDRLALTTLSPKFDLSDAFKNQNLYLLKNPPLPPKRIVKTPKPFIKRVKRKGSLDTYSFAFPSRVETLQLKNNTVYGQYFKLNNRVPKSTAILLHDMHESRHRYQEKHAVNLTRNGHNCIILTMPYHIERSTKRSSKGCAFKSTDLRTVFEGLQQATKDILSLINWLAASGEKKIGLIGIGFGGLIAGLAASTTRKINYMILLSPATSPLQVTGFIASGRFADDRVDKTGLSKKQLLEITRPWEIENHKPLVSKSRIFIMEALHDITIPGDSVGKLWSAWDQPRLKRYPHGRQTLRASKRVFKDINAFLEEAFAQQKSAGLSK